MAQPHEVKTRWQMPYRHLQHIPGRMEVHLLLAHSRAAAYRNAEKTVYLVGIGFSRETRNVADWEAEEM